MLTWRSLVITLGEAMRREGTARAYRVDDPWPCRVRIAARSQVAARGAVLGARSARRRLAGPGSLARRGRGVGPHRTATGATGLPVPPTNGSATADSRKA
ncbi:hypothetical protein GCM10010341_21400 [Streptomyces noursei]|nr:hypothetical protein GCM10010341_21400 [Streptomyces noursei]